MSLRNAALLGLLAMTPVAAHAQSSIYTGTLRCAPSAGGAVPGGIDGITINSRNYQGTYTHLMTSAGIAGLQDFGRGGLVGRDLTMRGGGAADGVTLQTVIKASNTGQTYMLTARQVFSGKRFGAPQMRSCTGTARLVIG